jgi:hypothetical protein
MHLAVVLVCWSSAVDLSSQPGVHPVDSACVLCAVLGSAAAAAGWLHLLRCLQRVLQVQTVSETAVTSYRAFTYSLLTTSQLVIQVQVTATTVEPSECQMHMHWWSAGSEDRSIGQQCYNEAHTAPEEKDQRQIPLVGQLLMQP